jgi:hypothetical protein
VLRPSERGIMIGLAGYITGRPTFRFIQRAYGDPDMGYVLDYPINYYLSGEAGPVKIGEDRLRSDGLTTPRPTAEITDKLKAIVADCIEQYPAVLRDPVETLTLSEQ